MAEGRGQRQEKGWLQQSSRASSAQSSAAVVVHRGGAVLPLLLRGERQCGVLPARSALNSNP
eukprot:scaffold12750_cov168-Ochromonas_danica.AAC.2